MTCLLPVVVTKRYWKSQRVITPFPLFPTFHSSGNAERKQLLAKPCTSCFMHFACLLAPLLSFAIPSFFLETKRRVYSHKVFSNPPTHTYFRNSFRHDTTIQRSLPVMTNSLVVVGKEMRHKPRRPCDLPSCCWQSRLHARMACSIVLILLKRKRTLPAVHMTPASSRAIFNLRCQLS